MKETRLVELLHNLTRARYRITFTHDFSGMLTVIVERPAMGDNPEFSTHWHCGTPHGPIKNLERDLRNTLAGIEE